MRVPLPLCLSVLLLVGCLEAPPPPPPVDPVPAGAAVIPDGMPNDKWFQEHVLSSQVPVLVDMTATWCGPCQAMKPAIHDIEKAYGSRLKVVEIDVDEHQYLKEFFRVNGIPRLIVIKDGQIQADQVGGRSYYQIVAMLKPTVGKP